MDKLTQKPCCTCALIFCSCQCFWLTNRRQPEQADDDEKLLNVAHTEETTNDLDEPEHRDCDIERDIVHDEGLSQRERNQFEKKFTEINDKNQKLKLENKILKSKPLQKVVVIGPSGAGKTALIEMLTKNTFIEDYVETVGVDVRAFKVKALNSETRVQIYDTPGNERYIQMTKNFLRSADGILLVADSYDEEGRQKILKFNDMVNEHLGSFDVPVVLCINKGDLIETQQDIVEEGIPEMENLICEEEEFYKFCYDQKFDGVFCVSAKTNKKVATAFEYLVLEMMQAEEQLRQVVRLDNPAEAQVGRRERNKRCGCSGS